MGAERGVRGKMAKPTEERARCGARLKIEDRQVIQLCQS